MIACSISCVLMAFVGCVAHFRHKISGCVRYSANGCGNYCQLASVVCNCPTSADPDAILYLHREGRLFSADMANRANYNNDIVRYDSRNDSIADAEAERLINNAQVRRKIHPPKKTSGNLRYGAAMSTVTLEECGDLNTARIISEGHYEPEQAVYRVDRFESTKMEERWGTQEYVNVINTPESSDCEEV